MTTTVRRRRSREIVNNDHIWFFKYWRPSMAWLYFSICLFDLLLAPFFWSAIQVVSGEAITQWDPITLKAGGLFHLSMGAIVGVTAWSRTLEKLEMIRNVTGDMRHHDPEQIHEGNTSEYVNNINNRQEPR